MSHPDPYWKLRPFGPTPPEEICGCDASPPIVLMDRFADVPLACLRCKSEIPPERVGFTETLSDQIACWQGVSRALYQLWLNSGQYEDWAREQLEDPNGQVNVEGLAIVEELNRYRRTYYWWFEDNTLEGFIPHSTCPRCGGGLVEAEDMAVCEPCSIVVPEGASHFSRPTDEGE